MRGIFGLLVAASAARTLFAYAMGTEDENKESVPDPEHANTVSSILAGPRPLFQFPFPCGQQWRMDTWAHAPALDMVREPNQVGTEGALLIAPADGVVNQSFRHANAGNMIQIDHGDGWFTTYIHLESRAVSVGQQVMQGQSIGRVGKDGATSNGHPHLHFELAIDANGDGRATWGAANTERVRPWFNGIEYGQSNGQTWRNTTSFNCGGGVVGGSRSFRYGNQQHVFGRAPNRSLHHWYWDPSLGVGQQDWGGQLTDDPVGFVYGNQQHMFGRAPDGSLHHWYWDPNLGVAQQNWGGQLVGVPTAFVYGYQQHVFARSPTGALHHWFWDPSLGVGQQDWGGQLF